jgi:uncharacterized protein YqgV (UPF0045/DUF77 family)
MHLVWMCVAIDHVVAPWTGAGSVALPIARALIIISPREVRIIVTPTPTCAEERTIIEAAIVVERIAGVRLCI